MVKLYLPTDLASQEASHVSSLYVELGDSRGYWPCKDKELCEGRGVDAEGEKGVIGEQGVGGKSFLEAEAACGAV